MKVPWGLVNEVTMNLISMASSCIGDSISNHLFSIITKPSELVPKFGSGLMSSTCAIKGFFERLLRFLPQKIPQQDSII